MPPWCGAVAPSAKRPALPFGRPERCRTMQELIIPLDWEVAPAPTRSTQHAATATGQVRRPLAGRSNRLELSAALRHEVARTAALGGLDESPRPTDVAGYTRSGSSFFLSQYPLQPNTIMSLHCSCLAQKIVARFVDAGTISMASELARTCGARLKTTPVCESSGRLR